MSDSDKKLHQNEVLQETYSEQRDEVTEASSGLRDNESTIIDTAYKNAKKTIFGKVFRRRYKKRSASLNQLDHGGRITGSHRRKRAAMMAGATGISMVQLFFASSIGTMLMSFLGMFGGMFSVLQQFQTISKPVLDVISKGMNLANSFKIPFLRGSKDMSRHMVKSAKASLISTKVVKYSMLTMLGRGKTSFMTAIALFALATRGSDVLMMFAGMGGSAMAGVDFIMKVKEDDTELIRAMDSLEKKIDITDIKVLENVSKNYQQTIANTLNANVTTGENTNMINDLEDYKQGVKQSQQRVKHEAVVLADKTEDFAQSKGINLASYIMPAHTQQSDDNDTNLKNSLKVSTVANSRNNNLEQDRISFAQGVQNSGTKIRN
jgi:hypothetical protein